MVKGIDIFREHFRDFSDRYMLIGGVACSLIFEELGIDFRGTRDIDIVLNIAARSGDFIKTFWRFIELGRYRNVRNSTGKRLFYRFDKPEVKEYPDMLELFSPEPALLKYRGKGHLTPIPAEGEVSSLSAILLNGEYYDFIRNGVRKIKELPVVGPECLIPLKALAWLDLRKRSDDGKEKIDSKKIQKHRDDIFRLIRAITSEEIFMPDKMKEDIVKFTEAIKEEEETIKLEKFEITNRSLDDVIEMLKNKYGIR